MIISKKKKIAVANCWLNSWSCAGIYSLLHLVSERLLADVLVASNLTSYFSFFVFIIDSYQGTVPDIKKCQEALSDTQKVISEAVDTLSSRNFIQMFVVSAMLFFVISPVIFPVADNSPLSLHHVAGKILYVIRIATTVFLSGFLFYLILNMRDEYSAYRSAQQMIDIQLKQISPRKRMTGNSCL